MVQPLGYVTIQTSSFLGVKFQIFSAQTSKPVGLTLPMGEDLIIDRYNEFLVAYIESYSETIENIFSMKKKSIL